MIIMVRAGGVFRADLNDQGGGDEHTEGSVYVNSIIYLGMLRMYFVCVLCEWFFPG